MKRNKFLLLTCILVAFLVVWLKNTSAEIVAGGDPAFRQALEQCSEEFETIGGEAKNIWDHLSAPSPNSKRHTIQPPPVSGNFQNQMTTNGPGGTLTSSGSPGPGTGSTIQWDSTDSRPYPSPSIGVSRHPCVSLLHELKHAYDADRGRLNPKIRTNSPPPPPTIPPLTESEVDACGTENRYRQDRSKKIPPPLGERRFYGPYGLPQNALFQ